MRAVMVMFDTLNRHMLPAYGCDWTKVPNFKRLQEKTVTFDNAYVGSMPCMPARREIHTGRHNFLHRSWSPLEPFDDSMPQILKQNGIYTHLATDHQHYFEDGGCTYHGRYNSWEFFRGQEGDPFIGQVKDPEIPDCLHPPKATFCRQDWIQRPFMAKEEQQPQPQTFKAGLEFIERNQAEDDWFLQIETFDPHEPFFTQQKWKDLYPHDYDGPHFDWPPYGKCKEDEKTIHHMRYEYAALLSMCDHYLGKVLDKFDEHNLWEDTLLIVNTDHGFMLGEHESWAKCWCPFYQEIAHMPLFVWDPRLKLANERRQSLVQTIDLPATLLEFFGQDLPNDMQGRPLYDTLKNDAKIRDAAIFGIHGGHVNVTDGRYVYMRGPSGEENNPLFNYTLMPTHMRSRFGANELQDIKLAEAFSFTKGCRTMKLSAGGKHNLETNLYDIQNDPEQASPIQDPQVEEKLIGQMVQLMKDNDAPAEQFERLGVTAYV